MSTGKPKTETTTTQGYSGAQGGIDQALAGASDWYNSNKGPLAPLNSYTKDALNQTRTLAGLAGQPVQGLAEASAYNTNLIANGGYTDNLRQTRGYLDNFANGSYTEDPRLLASIAEREKRAMNGAATQFGGGRYGSAAIGQGMGTAMATAGNDMMLQSNENSRNRQLQASGLMGQMDESARGAAMQGMGMIPMLDNQRYAGAERLAGVGDFFQNRRQTIRDQEYDKLQQYSGLLGSLGGYGSTTVKPKAGSSAQSAMGGAMAGASAGSAFGPWGTAIGAVGGGVLGYMS